MLTLNPLGGYPDLVEAAGLLTDELCSLQSLHRNCPYTNFSSLPLSQPPYLDRMAIIDSFAAFRDRAIQFGIEEGDVDKLKAKKFANFGAFTFISVYSAQSSDDKLLQSALTEVLEKEVSITEMARFRRLHFEANAITIADAKRRTEATGEDIPKRVPAPERAARYTDQVARLTGVTMTTNLEPSHALLDKVQQQLEENQASYVSPDLCTSRSQEIKGVRKDVDATAVIVEAAGRFLKVADHEPQIRTAVNCDYALRQALRRRALAYDQTGLASYACMEEWSERLFFAMEQEPPPLYHAVAKSQIITADRELWIRVIERCRSGILPVLVAGTITRPVETAVRLLMVDPTVLTFLAHLPRPASAASIDHEMNLEYGPDKRRRKGEQKGPPKGKGRGNGKAAGKGGKGQAGKLPSALAGCWKIVKGQKPCLWFNQGICRAEVAPGEKCSHGIHLCMGAGCGEPHSFAECPRKKGKK